MMLHDQDESVPCAQAEARELPWRGGDSSASVCQAEQQRPKTARAREGGKTLAEMRGKRILLTCRLPENCPHHKRLTGKKRQKNINGYSRDGEDDSQLEKHSF